MKKITILIVFLITFGCCYKSYDSLGEFNTCSAAGKALCGYGSLDTQKQRFGQQGKIGVSRSKYGVKAIFTVTKRSQGGGRVGIVEKIKDIGGHFESKGSKNDKNTYCLIKVEPQAIVSFINKSENKKLRDDLLMEDYRARIITSVIINESQLKVVRGKGKGTLKAKEVIQIEGGGKYYYKYKSDHPTVEGYKLSALEWKCENNELILHGLREVHEDDLGWDPDNTTTRYPGEKLKKCKKKKGAKRK